MNDSTFASAFLKSRAWAERCSTGREGGGGRRTKKMLDVGTLYEGILAKSFSRVNKSQILKILGSNEVQVENDARGLHDASRGKMAGVGGNLTAKFWKRYSKP